MSRSSINPSQAAELADVSRADLRVLRNVIYVRRGRALSAPSLQKRFGGSPWYHPDPSYTDARLTPVDRANIRTISGVERRKRGPMTERQYVEEECPGVGECP